MSRYSINSSCGTVQAVFGYDKGFYLTIIEIATNEPALTIPPGKAGLVAIVKQCEFWNVKIPVEQLEELAGDAGYPTYKSLVKAYKERMKDVVPEGTLLH